MKLTQYDQLKQIIQAANPEIMELKAYVCGNCGFDEELHYRPIRLADILLALQDKAWLKEVGDLVAIYNLKDDNLDHQSEETKSLLIDLLVTKDK